MSFFQQSFKLAPAAFYALAALTVSPTATAASSGSPTSMDGYCPIGAIVLTPPHMAAPFPRVHRFPIPPIPYIMRYFVLEIFSSREVVELTADGLQTQLPQASNLKCDLLLKKKRVWAIFYSKHIPLSGINSYKSLFNKMRWMDIFACPEKSEMTKSKWSFSCTEIPQNGIPYHQIFMMYGKCTEFKHWFWIK